MCGIFAYSGKENAIPLLINGLRNLEYRGYDSAGIMAIEPNGEYIYEREVGRVSNLATSIEKLEERKWNFNTWIAHTRWATHWGVTKENCHPHHSQNNRFFIVHNGIIENYKELKKELEKKYKFYSDTDTEIIANLIQDEFENDLKTTLEKVIKKLVWAYALVAVDTANPSEIIGVKLGSPMVVGAGESGVFISSDINALSQIAKEFTILEDYEFVIIKDNNFSIFSSGEKIEKKAQEINTDELKSDLGSFDCYTEKEIFDIPEVLENVFSGRINFAEKKIVNETLLELNEYDIERIEIIASGSSYFAWYMGSYYFKELAWIPANITTSSEFLCDNFILDKKALYVFLSQSWETADVRESLKIVKEKGWLTFGIVNVVWSTIARLADMGLFSHAGVEIGVASTKNVIAQIAILLLMSISLGLKRSLQHTEARFLIEEIDNLNNAINKVLASEKKIQEIAKKYAHYSNFFFLGRNLLYPVAWECSLKLKELSYIHSEAYSTWELKHWPLALVGPDFPCIILNPKWVFHHKNVSNIKEIRARNGKVLWIITERNIDNELYDDMIEIPEVSERLTPFVILTAMYLFSYYIASELGREIDKPRNLAKSVTVE
jgi:glutamine---fructose-6-phosphate transaminase (isomerizing)